MIGKRYSWLIDVLVVALVYSVAAFAMLVQSWGVAERCSPDRVEDCQAQADTLFGGALILMLLGSVAYIAARLTTISYPSRILSLLAFAFACCVLLGVGLGQVS